MSHQDARKRLVAAGYDRIAERYLNWAGTIEDVARARHTALLLDRLPAGARLLDLGCGAGLPTTAALAAWFRVVGVDLSARQLALARRNVPMAAFVQADMARLPFGGRRFDAVTAFYSVTHVPRDEHAALFGEVAAVLRPGGLFVASLGAGATDGVEDDWLGAPTYFSHWDAETTLALLREAGFEMLSAQVETLDEHGTPVSFLWAAAQKPASG